MYLKSSECGPEGITSEGRILSGSEGFGHAAKLGEALQAEQKPERAKQVVEGSGFWKVPLASVRVLGHGRGRAGSPAAGTELPHHGSGAQAPPWVTEEKLTSFGCSR